MTPPRPIPSSEITPEGVYLNRRSFLQGGALAGSMLITGGAYRLLNQAGGEEIEVAELPGLVRPGQAFAESDSPIVIPGEGPDAAGLDAGEELASPAGEVAEVDGTGADATAGSDDLDPEMAADGGREQNAGETAAEGQDEELADGVQVAQAERKETGNDAANRDPAGNAESKGYTTKEAQTPFRVVTNYNNFYEFTTSKERVSAVARNFVAKPWTVEVDGLVHNPKTFDLDEILKLSPPEERIYRMRCVEGWSMVIPWAGFSLSKLLKVVEPLGKAKYVAFETLLDPQRMPGQKTRVLDWPYVEGLRLDEALHPLTLLASGLYGKELPNANGAPLRLVVPWKYGFKGIKSIVRITLTETQPRTSWNESAPYEYGFYANVNPQVDHPRWSQATEQRLGKSGRQKTLMFNGYAEQVAHMYEGLDLRRNF